MRVWVVGVLLLLVAGCSRDLSLPPPPGPTPPGTVYGRVVYAEPGNSAKVPAVGATVQLLSSSISAVADDEGRFLLAGISETSGSILIRFGARPDGTYARQRILKLEQLGAGPGRDISVGDVTVAENAQVRGKLLRGNLTTASGHVGSTIFVPEGPFTAQTADDGSYELSNLPEGTLTLVFFRPGYVPQTLSDISLQSGESLTLRTLSLELDPSPQVPGSISGSVAFSPALADASGATVEARDGINAPITVNAEISGAFRFDSLPPGLYTLTFRHSDYTQVAVPNLLVASGAQVVLGTVVLTKGPALPELDAGVQPQPDGGNAGSDGGLNGNLKPVAKVNLPMVVRVKDPVQLSAVGSLDPEGEPLRYLWEDLSDAGINITPNNVLVASQPTFIAPPSPTTVTVRLTVTDPEGLSDTAITQIDVVRPPVAQISPSSLALRPGETGFLSGGGSVDPSNLPLAYDWDVDQSMLPLTLTSLADGGVSVTAPGTSGLGRVTLVARNEVVSSFPTSVDVTVAANSTLSVSAGADQSASFGTQVTLQATGNSNNPNDLLSYSWAQLSGPSTVTLNNASSQQASFTAPTSPGVLTFQVTMSIPGGQFVTDDVAITVLDNVAPTATALDPVGSGIGSPLYATLQFSKSMDTASVENPSNVYVTGTSGVVPATVKYDSLSHIARVSYLTPLTANGSYTLHVDGATDDTPNQNALTGWTSPFTARAFQTSLFTEPTPTTSTIAIHPWIARTPLGVYAVGQLQSAGYCSNNASLFGVRVDEGNAQLSSVSGLTSLCATSGTSVDWGPKAASAGTLWVHTRDGGAGNYYYRLVGSSFVQATSALEQLAPHGTAMFSAHLFGASGAAQLSVYAYDSSSNSFAVGSPLATADCSANDLYGVSGEGDGVNFFAGCYRPSKTGTGVFSLSGSSWTELGNVGQSGNGGVGRARIRVHQGKPVVTQAESFTGVWSVNAYRAATNSASTTFTRLGGGPVNPSNSVTVFDSAVLGDELFVAYLDGNQVFVKRTDLLGSGTWTAVAGPNTGGTMNVDLSCLADRPSLDAGPEGVWLAWSEGCGGTPSWHTLVRKVY